MAVRTIALWFPDWPVVTAAAAAGVAPGAPAAVIGAGTVLACTASARLEGVRRGLRRREAQSRCPDLVVLPRNLVEEARAFEPVVAAVEASAPGVEVRRPGLCLVAARGPSRYFGGDARAAAHLAAEAGAAAAGSSAEVEGAPCRAGVADGSFAAALAARTGAVVPPGGAADFLAPHPVEVLDRPPLADLLRRLGLRTLGAFAALPAGVVGDRFGADGALAHRLARGLDPYPVAARRPPPDLVATAVLDPPADRVDQVAFVAKGLAEELHARLVGLGLACTRLGVEAETEHEERHARLWRHEGALTSAAIAERARWQLDGWLTGPPGQRPSGGVSVLRLVPDQVVPHGGHQLGVWGEVGEHDDQAARALARVQGVLGPRGVVTAVLTGGRGPGERVRLVPWGEARDAGPGEGRGRDGVRPWPGRLPPPSPATVPPRPRGAVVTDAAGRLVGVTARHVVTAAPAWVTVEGGPEQAVLAWAGPWPADERWWNPAAARRRARFQVLTADGAARLLALEGGRWWVEAIYD